MFIGFGRNAGLCAAGRMLSGEVVLCDATGAGVVLGVVLAAALRALPITC